MATLIPPNLLNNLLGRSVLIFDAQPAMTFIVSIECLRCHCIGKGKEGSLLSPLLPQCQIHLQYRPLHPLLHADAHQHLLKTIWSALSQSSLIRKSGYLCADLEVFVVQHGFQAVLSDISAGSFQAHLYDQALQQLKDQKYMTLLAFYCCPSWPKCQGIKG